MEIASWRALDEKWHWPSNVCLPQPSERSPCSAGKKKTALDWEHTTTLGAGLIQTYLGKDQMIFSYFMILTLNFQIGVLWLVPKVKIAWFKFLIISTDYDIPSFLDKLDILPMSRLSRGGKISFLAKKTFLSFCHCMRERDKVPKLGKDSHLKTDAGH